MTCWGEREKIVLLLASVNSSVPEAAFSLKLPRPSELAPGTTLAVVAASPSVALAMSEETVFQFLPDLRWRLATMLPTVALAVPVFQMRR
jgi:hypothetical protein